MKSSTRNLLVATGAGLALVLTACGTSAGGSESDYLGSYTLVDDEFGTMVTVSVEGDVRTIETNALPDHETGEFPNQGNPNMIAEQDLTYAFPTDPNYVGSAGEVRTVGVAVNGVKFEPGTAETVACESGETYRIEALQDIYDLGLDFNNAHVQPTGEYHYHGISELLVEAYESDQDLVHVGFAADGYLMYYSKSGTYESGYELATRARAGIDCVASGPGSGAVDIDGTTPDGTYDLDWVWTEESGDLDGCNGTRIDGEYVYIVTDDYPYVTRCLNGEVTGDAGPPAGGAAPPVALGQPDLAAAAAVLGVSEGDLKAALGAPPPDLDGAASTLGVAVEELRAALDAAGSAPPAGG
jgi:hypothetical protein